MNCADFHDLLQQRLDGAPGPEPAGLDRHLAECAECRAWQAAARRLEEGLRRLTPPAPPAGLADRMVAGVLANRRARLRIRQRVFTAAALAAAVLLAVTFGPRWRTQPVTETPSGPAIAHVQPPAPAPAPAPLDGRVEDAGSALVAFMGQTVDEAMVHGRGLLPSRLPATPLPASDLLEQPLGPPVRSLRAAGESVSAGLEPVTTSARRAFDLFLQELPPLDRGKKAPTGKGA